MQRIPGRRIVLVMPNELIDKLERIERRHNLTRAEAMRTMMYMGFDVLDMFGGSMEATELDDQLNHIKRTIRATKAPSLV